MTYIENIFVCMAAPLLFYLAIFQPDNKQFQIAAVVTGASFATFENVCYLT